MWAVVLAACMIYLIIYLFNVSDFWGEKATNFVPIKFKYQAFSMIWFLIKTKYIILKF